MIAQMVLYRCRDLISINVGIRPPPNIIGIKIKVDKGFLNTKFFREIT